MCAFPTVFRFRSRRPGRRRSFRRRARELNANYTFSKNIDNGSSDTGSSLIDSFNLRLHRGWGAYDIPHNFNVSVIYVLPVGKNQRFGPGWPRWVDALAGGWDLGILTTLQSGYTRTISSRRATTANEGWANYTGDRKIGGVERKGDGVFYFTPEEVARFSFPAAGEIGTSGRNAFRTEGWRSTDVSLVKRFRVAERQAITFRGEFYHVFNHTSFGNFGTPPSEPRDFREGQHPVCQPAHHTSGAAVRFLRLG